jgi:hypothetical protein
MNFENVGTRNITVAATIFVTVTALLLASISVATVSAKVGYDAGEKLKGFTYNHKGVSESKAKLACTGKDQNECIECMEHRADLDGLKGYEVVKCLKEPNKYNY